MQALIQTVCPLLFLSLSANCTSCKMMQAAGCFGTQDLIYFKTVVIHNAVSTFTWFKIVNIKGKASGIPYVVMAN